MDAFMITAAWELIPSAKEFGCQMAKRNRKRTGRERKIFGCSSFERWVKEGCRVQLHILIATFHSPSPETPGFAREEGQAELRRNVAPVLANDHVGAECEDGSLPLGTTPACRNALRRAGTDSAPGLHQGDAFDGIQPSPKFYLNNEMKKNKGLFFFYSDSDSRLSGSRWVDRVIWDQLDLKGNR